MDALLLGYAAALTEPDTAVLLAIAVIAALALGAIALTRPWTRVLHTHEEASEGLRYGFEWTASVAHGLHQAVFLADADGAISFLNAGAEHALGWKSPEVEGRKVHAVLHPDHAAAKCPVTGAILGKTQVHITDEVFARKDGSTYPVDFFATPLLDGDRVCGSVVAFQGIESRKEVHQVLDFGSLHDGLTAAPNRTLFFDRLYQLVLKSKRSRGVFAVVMFDIDGLRHVNEQFGNDAGDAVLQQVARRMRSCLRESDTLARLGGDEFAVLLNDIDEPRARLAAHRLVSAVEQPFAGDKGPISVDVDFGVAMYPQDGEEADLLVRHADVAMYLSKQIRGTEAG